MHWMVGASWVAALVGMVSAAPALGASTFVDPETGFTFSEYQTEYALGRTIAFRVAIPADATANSEYDVVLQAAAPNDVGWAGLAWGGTMVDNPLTIGWANGGSVVVSSQRATGARVNGPNPWNGASYEILSKGTRVNGSHWQFTAKCSGCAAFEGTNGRMRYLNPSGSNNFAFATSASRPYNPSSNVSDIPVHNVHVYWSHDFSTGKNANFEELVAQNL